MAATSTTDRRLRQLQADNKRLRADNTKLRKQLASKSGAPSSRGSFFRKIGVAACLILAVILLFAGNILFWGGNTVVKTDRYVAATAPLIRDSAIQNALATNVTAQLFKTVNINQLTSQALPPRADFLAPALADQIRQHADDTVRKILQRPQFQNRWNDAQEHAHDSFIRTVDAHGSDGSIDIGEVYGDVSQQLKGGTFGFLAGKPLPASVGTIQLASGSWLTVLQRTIQHIDAWRTIAIAALALFSALGVWLSRDRRRTVAVLGSLFALAMLLTLIGLRLMREVLASKVSGQDAEAVRHAYTIVAHGLVVQTATILCASLVLVFVAWISGSSAGSRKARQLIDRLFSGKLHAAIFSRGENRFTTWIGAHKRTLQWLAVIVVACSTLLIRLTPAALLWQLIILLVLVLAAEVLAAKP